MKNLKKDNKGFSLVELIVVVLIMAIIAVALAPQVIKWVNNSRISSDNNTKEAVISAVQTCLTDETVFKDVKTTAVKVTVDNDECEIVTGPDSFCDKFGQYSSTNISSSNKKTSAFKTKQKDCKITVEVDNNGKLSVTVSGGESDISDK